MPALASFNRILQVLPAGSPAYTHIYRLCSSSSSTPQSASAPSSAGNGGGNAAPSAAPRTPPAPLDLGLNFATMDFDAVAKATHAAMARERGIGASTMSVQREQDYDAKLDRQSEQSGSRFTTPLPPSSSPAPPPSTNASFGNYTKGRAPAAATASSASSGRGFARAEQRSGVPWRADSSTTRRSLHDLLKDCLIEGNWAKAYQMFLNAVNQACRQVLLPAAGSTIAASSSDLPPASASATEELDSAREAECLASLRKMLAALPPTSAHDSRASAARRANVKNLRGIMRWNGTHYYLLWKCLLEAGRVEEVQRVWSVMQQVGFADYQMEERTVNTLMALLRRTSIAAEKAAAKLVSAAFTHAESFDSRLEREKSIRRELVKDLEQVAAARDFHLVGSNRRTAEGIRIAEALRRVEGADDEHGLQGSGDNLEAALHEGTKDASSTVSAPLFRDPEESIIAVGDFNGLLRRSRSTESTQRVLQMMAKLKLEMESSTFASLIASLHNPQYVLDGHTAEELASHAIATPATHLPSSAVQHATSDPTVSASAENDHPNPVVNDSASAAIDTKTQYEAYKQERVETALRWFFQCPKPRRSAEVYNELLYLLRSKTHWKDFDKALVEMRGNAVVTEEEWPEVTPAAPSEGVPSAVPAVLPPKWTTPPNGKTYELIIQRARYVHQWDVMWELYEEMVSSGVRGTTRLYEVLLAEATQHPPRALHGVEIGGGASRESSEVSMRLYDELRRNGGDVRSFKSTVNVVNAWSKSRAKMNRWE